ncbi:hypothetical protein Q8A64_10780 [Oxalobacteraceae bacterium R-40]|uniref:Uncharacterized protein n=1 Tax=Keguizhuia sedimenti TaxID=3064264 RepID=A0ABU1BPS8_9BURK|nr:hypothetical protein [Oxalobacteraceae bacterium R-40]
MLDYFISVIACREFPYKYCIFSMCADQYTGDQDQMEVVKCISVFCGRPFQVNVFTTKLNTSYQPGIIKCPHCGTSTASSPDSLFLTHALSVEEEIRFNSRCGVPQAA